MNVFLVSLRTAHKTFIHALLSLSFLISFFFPLVFLPALFQLDAFTARYVHSFSYWLIPPFIQCFIWDFFLEVAPILHWSWHGHLQYEQDFQSTFTRLELKTPNRGRLINDSNKTTTLAFRGFANCWFHTSAVFNLYSDLPPAIFGFLKFAAASARIRL